jgi:hypothetical protein
MRTVPNRMILGEEFNCLFAQAGCEGKVNFSRALQRMVQGYDVVEVWSAKPT